MKFNINDYEGDYAMHCKTEEEAKSFCEYLHKCGLKWSSGDSYFDKTNWEHYKANTVYDFNDDTFCDIRYFQRNNYIILEWEDFMNNTFTKADLKTGDIIKRRNGDVEIVNLELDMLICKSGWNDLDNIREDLTCKISEEFDIVAVRRPITKVNCQFDAFKYGHGTLVYEREEPVEMTLAEVCKLLGKNIKIIK